MSVFNPINWTSGENILVTFVKQTGDSISSGSYGNPIGIAIIFIVGFISLSITKFSFGISLAITGFFTSVISLLLTKLGMLPQSFILINIAMFLLGVFILMLNKE